MSGSSGREVRASRSGFTGVAAWGVGTVVSDTLVPGPEAIDGGCGGRELERDFRLRVESSLRSVTVVIRGDASDKGCLVP